MVIAGLFAAVLACSRPQPSPEYERARELWTAVVKERGEAAAEDPRADEALALLDRVPGDSLDAAPAGELRARIVSQRAASAEERERRARLLERAGPPASPPAAPEEGEAAGAPAPKVATLARGMKLDDFRSALGGCALGKGSAQLPASDGGPRAGEVWVLKDEASCREQYPQLAGQAAIFVGDALAWVSPLSSIRREEVHREVELGTLPDGGQGMIVEGRVVPLPPGAKIVAADGGER